MTEPGDHRIVVVMGVCGAGKTTIGRALAAACGWPFLDADDLHPEPNRRKMAAGQPLVDDDRAPWLAAVRGWMIERLADGSGVVACSALKRPYRDALRIGDAVTFVALTGDRALLEERLAARRDHFMPPALLGSQLATLEPLRHGPTLDVREPPEVLVTRLVEHLGASDESRRSVKP